ncbi:unnamed protein product [Spirodela intermedia]|uniref:Uncharacterized protein n=1 Tax=Spirodela intermedia TaxID=51605 RepID=A0A7I8L9Q1_SPIIN|nr:unnamed protein product [Spirodela intermedia]
MAPRSPELSLMTVTFTLPYKLYSTYVVLKCVTRMCQSQVEICRRFFATRIAVASNC